MLGLYGAASSEYFTSVKMLSDRILNAEVVNGEGGKSEHLSDALNFLYLTGAEYNDVFPAWDWTKPRPFSHQGQVTSELGKFQIRIARSAHVWVFDNDDLRHPFRLVAVYEIGQNHSIAQADLLNGSLRCWSVTESEPDPKV